MGEAIPHILQGALGAIEKKQERERREELSKLILESIQDKVIQKAQPEIQPEVIGAKLINDPLINTATQFMHGVDVPIAIPEMSEGREAIPQIARKPTSSEVLSRLVKGVQRHPLTKTIPTSDILELTKAITGLRGDETNDIKNYEYAIQMGIPKEKAERKFLGEKEGTTTADIQKINDLIKRGYTQEEAVNVVYKTKTQAFKKWQERNEAIRMNPNMTPEERIDLDKNYGIISSGDFDLVKDYDPLTGEIKYIPFDKIRTGKDGISVTPQPPKEIQEFMAYDNLSDEQKARFKEYKKVSENPSYAFRSKTDENGISTLIAINKNDLSDVRVVATLKVPQKLTEQDIVDLYMKYNNAKLKAPTDPFRLFMVETMKQKGLSVNEQMPELTYEQFKEMILKDTPKELLGSVEPIKETLVKVWNPELLKWENVNKKTLKAKQPYWQLNPDFSQEEYVVDENGTHRKTGRRVAPIVKDYSKLSDEELAKLVRQGNKTAYEEAKRRQK